MNQEIIDTIITNLMKENIERAGNDKYWKFIEGINDAKKRCRFRKYFFMAKGTIPKREE